jgi:hypothetical protein
MLARSSHHHFFGKKEEDNFAHDYMIVVNLALVK